MRLGELLAYFETSPALRLLRAQNAPFVIDFLDAQFKRAGRISIPHSELLAALVAYQEELQEAYPDRFAGRADAYLNDWCAARWLRRSLEAGCDEPVYQLTPHAEDVFGFLDRTLGRDRGFVGTESRLKLVIDALAGLAIESSDDPDARLAHLREEQRRIGEEIEKIEASGRAEKLRPAQARERFSNAVSLLRQLQSDFRAVEESFRAITLQVQQRYVEGRETRGGILEFALDAEDLLKKEDQGVTFYEFVRLVLDPAQTARLEEIIHEVREIPELGEQQEGLDTVRGMVTLLQNEAEQVMRTNQRLSATLRRLLDGRTSAERRRVAGLLREIRGHAVSLAAEPPLEEVGIEVEADLDIESPFRRTFWSEPPRFDAADLTGYEADERQRLDAFRRLAALHRLDWREMRGRIRSLSDFRSAPTLADLLNVHPPEAGVVEVLGYLQIAREDGHLVDAAACEEVVVPSGRNGDRPLLLTVPLVTFVSRGNNAIRSNGHAR
jgi:hypothetical protein